MNSLLQDLETVCFCAFVFVSVWCLLLATFDNGPSYQQSQYMHVDDNKRKKKYYFCYCKNGRKDKVIHMIEVSAKTFNNVTTYHDSYEIIHIGRNKVYLDANVSGSSFSKLTDVHKIG